LNAELRRKVDNAVIAGSANIAVTAARNSDNGLTLDNKRFGAFWN
jgi:hypothetical protein